MLDAQQLLRRLQELTEPAQPYVFSLAASTSAYTLGLALTQAAGMVCRVSSATPVMGSLMGCVGIGVSSSMAGQAAIWARGQKPTTHIASLQRPSRWRIMADDVAVDAFIGMLLFKLMGGSFRSLLPSDLFRAGALARESLPATRGAEYATPTNKGELVRMMRRDGCHHCGKRRGKVVGDHIPPNKLAAQTAGLLPDSLASFLREPLGYLQKQRKGRSSWLAGKRMRQLPRPLQKAGVALGLGLAPQRYYPQCARCSQRQAAAVRSNRRTLVLHFGGMRPWFFAGPLVGLRHFQAPGQPPNGGGKRRPLLVLSLAEDHDDDDNTWRTSPHSGGWHTL